MITNIRGDMFYVVDGVASLHRQKTEAVGI